MQTASASMPNNALAVDLVVSAGPSTELHSSKVDTTIREQVWSLLSTLYPKARPIERRRAQRYPYPHLIRLMPVDGSPAVVVAGKNLSEEGICFYHLAPLAVRKVIVTLEAGDNRRASFLTDLTWCRFTRQGWYESGGTFIESVVVQSS